MSLACNIGKHYVALRKALPAVPNINTYKSSHDDECCDLDTIVKWGDVPSNRICCPEHGNAEPKAQVTVLQKVSDLSLEVGIRFTFLALEFGCCKETIIADLMIPQTRMSF